MKTYHKIKIVSLILITMSITAWSQEAKTDNKQASDKAFIYYQNACTIGPGANALGASCISNNLYSFAEGNKCNATGRSSFAAGELCAAQAPYSFAMGQSSVASGTSAFAMGYQCTAQGHFSFAMGRNSKSYGTTSFAIGENAHAKGEFSYAFGRDVYAGNAGVSIGSFLGSTTTTNLRSMTMGSGIDATNRLINNKRNTLMIGFNSTNPTLFVSESRNVSGSTTNTGSVGIGTDSPAYKLHIKSNRNEEASLYLQNGTYGPNDVSRIYMGRNDHHYIEARPSKGLKVKSPWNIALLGAKVGIGTESPLYALHIKDNSTRAIMYLQPSNFSSGSHYATFYMGNTSNYMQSQYSKGIKLNSNWNIALMGSKVGIGTTNPTEKLDVNGKTKTTSLQLTAGARDGFVLLSDASGNASWKNQQTINDGDWDVVGSNVVRTTGNVGIGTSSPSEKLHVSGNTKLTGTLAVGDAIVPWGYILAAKGKVIAEEIVVQTYAKWPDYVFNEDYELMPISELKTYIAQHKHLPDVPTQEDVSKDGVSLGGTSAALLKKIEELTLYIIEQQEKIEKLEKKMEQLDCNKQ